MNPIRSGLAHFLGLIFVLTANAFAGGARTDFGRLQTYSLWGSPYEIGFSSVKLAPKSAFSSVRGMTPYMAEFATNLVQNQDAIQGNWLFESMVEPILDRRYRWDMREKIPEEHIQLLKGIADAASLSLESIENAFIVPDVVHLLVADALSGKLPFMSASKLDLQLAARPVSPLGCTTMMIPPNLTTNGKLIVGRVQDYVGGGRFDANPAVYFVRKPKKYKYVLVSTAGIPVGGITAMNEKGLVLSWHAVNSFKATQANFPGMTTTTKIIENAKTIEQAHQLCEKYVPAAGWVFNVADTASGKPRMAHIEVLPAQKKCALVWNSPDAPMVATNHYFSKEAQKDQVRPGTSFFGNSFLRQARVFEMIIRDYANQKIGVTDVMKMLADRKDIAANRFTAYSPSTISVSDQIVSAVFVPENLELWVSDGMSPPASHGVYHHFSFHELEHFHEKNFRRDQTQEINIEALLKDSPSNLKNFPGYEFFHRATLTLDPSAEYNSEKAVLLINEAIKREPQEPLLYLLRGMIYMNMRFPMMALREFTLALEIHRVNPLDQHRLRVTKMQMAKCLDIIGRRLEALPMYKEILDDPNSDFALKVAAIKFLQAPFEEERLGETRPDAKFIDTYRYD